MRCVYPIAHEPEGCEIGDSVGAHARSLERSELHRRRRSRCPFCLPGRCAWSCILWSSRRGAKNLPTLHHSLVRSACDDVCVVCPLLLLAWDVRRGHRLRWLPQPPDVFAAVGDGKDRGAKSLGDVLKASKRVFVCGLALDFCVLDTCINAVDAGLAPQQVHMVLDAARAAHIPGVGAFGSGFLSDPAGVRACMLAKWTRTPLSHIVTVPRFAL